MRYSLLQEQQQVRGTELRAGLPLYTQVASVAGDNVQLTNGLDIVIGTL